MDKEKIRKYPRLNLSCNIEYNIEYNIEHFPVETDSDLKHTRSKDISIGGMCFITYSPLPIGTVLNLKFKLKEEQEPIIIKGKIVWNEMFNIGGQKGWDNGIQFIDILEKDKKNILNYISSLL